jgi:hypothetical protein
MDKIRSSALKCIAMGLHLVPIGQHKIPAVKWKSLIDSPLADWNYPGCNMGILTGECNGIVVVDCDNRRSALMWLSTMPKTPLMVVSARGMHFYYRHPGAYVKSDSHIKRDGWHYDVKGDRSYVLAPPSVRNGHEYAFLKHEGNPSGKWICPDSLPVFDVAWRPERPASPSGTSKEIANVRSYVKKIFAAEGSRDRETFRVCKIAKEGGLSEVDAAALAIEWHMSNCTPPWEVTDIVEKVKRVYAGV